MTFEEYLKKETAQSIRSLALSIGVAQSTLARQLSGDRTLTLNTLWEIHLATGLEFYELGVRAGLITEDDANRARSQGSLRIADSQDILEELARRLRLGEELEDAPQPFQPLITETGPNGYPLAPDGEEFRPDVYQNHRMLWERYGENWREHYTLAAKKQVDGDDIDETYTL